MPKDHVADVSADYEASGFGTTLALGERPALLVVDFVRAYLDERSPLFAGVEKELANSARLVAAARAVGAPVVWTNVEYEPGGADGGYFYRKVSALKVFDRGSPLGAFDERLTPLESEVVLTKQYPSAFFGTDLDRRLKEKGVDTLLVCGVTTSGCVRASALDALQYGFLPVVVEDASGDRNRKVHDANIFDLGAKYAEIIDTGTACDYLSSVSP